MARRSKPWRIRRKLVAAMIKVHLFVVWHEGKCSLAVFKLEIISIRSVACEEIGLYRKCILFNDSNNAPETEVLK